MVKKKMIAFLFIIAILSSAFAGCTVSFKRNNTQNEKEYVVWQSESNDDGIVLKFKVLTERSHHLGTISFNGETHDICMHWGDLSFIIPEINYYGKEYDFNDISGSYKIKGENSVELEISADDMYGGALCGKTIVVNATDLTDRVSNVAERQEVCWETESDMLKLYTYQWMRNFSLGSFSDGETQKDIVVYWLPEGLFEAYELCDGVQQSDVVMYGEYVCGENTLELTYRIGDDETENELLLTAREILNEEYPNEVWYPAEE